MARCTLLLAVFATLAACRVEPDGDGDADVEPDAEFDDGVQHCKPDGDGDTAICPLEGTCCVAPEGDAYCCHVPTTVCVGDGTCREPCSATSERCIDVGEGGAVGCSPEWDGGILVCHAASPCWSVVLEPCGTGACHMDDGVPVCR